MRWRILAVVAALVATAGAHASIPRLRRSVAARNERLVRADLAQREEALASCLIGESLVQEEMITSRLLQIETALAARGEVVGNDETHWPGRCAPQALAVAELTHLGRGALPTRDVERLALVLGGGRPLDGVERAIALAAPSFPGSEADTSLTPLAPELDAALLPVWSPADLHGPGSSLVTGRLPVRVHGRECLFRAGTWLLDGCTQQLRAISPADAERLAERHPAPSDRVRPLRPAAVPDIPGTDLGRLASAPGDTMPTATQRWVSCAKEGQLVAVAAAERNPWETPRLVFLRDGVPQRMVEPRAPADQVRCDGDGVEVLGVREIENHRFAIQRDLCREGGCSSESVDLDRVVPPALRPRVRADAAVAAVGGDVYLMWRSPRHGVFLMGGPLEQLASSHVRYLLGPGPMPDHSEASIASLAVPAGATFVLVSFRGTDQHVVLAVDAQGKVSAIADEAPM